MGSLITLHKPAHYKDCDDACPLLGKCIKYRMAPEDLIKLEQIVTAWERDKTAIQFFASVGRLVQKLRVRDGRTPH